MSHAAEEIASQPLCRRRSVDRFDALLGEAAAVVLSGSLPRSLPDDALRHPSAHRARPRR
ncbi:hypothetical protein [Streptomyces sp. NPDC046712]|uniref:hypothetical protein n=1 Tax=Streptomyces sp. NPDC046712 TaxID=3154802 RepID=UPI0034006D2C